MLARLAFALAAACALPMAAAPATRATELPSPALERSSGAHLAAAPDGRIYLSWMDRLPQGRDALRFAVLDGDRWTTPRLVAAGRDWFVNWADFPSVVALPDGTLAAHWLVKSGDAPYAYDVWIARSADGGDRWGAPFRPHRDGTQTEHGFVSLFPARDGRLGVAWLDGRATDPGAQGHAHGGGGAMTLRYASIGDDGAPADEALLDARVCDCCQTAAAMTDAGPVLVYRDRSAGELRDIAIVRGREAGWSAPEGLPADGWHIAGCPVNGPAVAARGRRVAVAWFTAADDAPRVKLAFSGDAGAGFGAPVTVDDGRPQGRVDTLMLEDGSAVVSWVESVEAGSALRVRRIGPGGRRGAAVTVVPAGAGLANCFPQMARDGSRLVFAWTAGRIRTAVLPLAALPDP